MMYWNFRYVRFEIFNLSLEPKHMMYWNPKKASSISFRLNLNQNIWCIEITQSYLSTFLECLEPKHMMYWNTSVSQGMTATVTWTKTYDVLKYLLNILSSLLDLTWTKTYDVLKSRQDINYMMKKILNQNIWCIEIKLNYQVIEQLFYLEPKHMMYWNLKT